MARRERIEPTDDWDQLVLLFEWPKQEEYELIRQPGLFGTSVAERTRETVTPERTLYWKMEQFDPGGLRGSGPGRQRHFLLVLSGTFVVLSLQGAHLVLQCQLW
jgi:hypothetical protein